MGHNYEGNYGPAVAADRWKDGILPDDVYEVSLQAPLGIRFEENGYPKRGVTAIEILEGSNAERSGQIAVGDYLVGVTGVTLIGSKFERRCCDCSKWDYDTVVSAIGSNEERFGCKDVILQFQREGTDAGLRSRDGAGGGG